MTRNGGGTAFESFDGKAVYYTKGTFSGALWKIPAEWWGGEPGAPIGGLGVLFASSTKGSISFRNSAPIGSLPSSS